MGMLMHALKLVRAGDAPGLPLQREALARLERGAEEDPSPSVHNSAIHEQLRAGRDFIRDYRDALRMLAE